MTATMSVDDGALSVESNVLPFIFQDSDTNHPHTNQLPFNSPVDETTGTVLDEDQSGRGVTSHHITQPAAEIPTQDEQINFSQSVNMQEATTTSREPVGPVDPRLRDEPPSSLQTDDSIGAPDVSAHTEDGSNVTSKTRSKPTMASMMLLSVGILSAIVVPGVVLGVVVKQAPMGIALCGAIATVVGVFAGFYYFQDKKR